MATSTRNSAGAATEASKRRPSSSRLAVATMMVIALTSTVTQFLAASTLGIAHLVQWVPLSTGGIVALVGGLVMWIWCPDWSSWRRWIWLWIAVVATLTLVATSVQSHSVDTAAPSLLTPLEQVPPTAEHIPAGFTDIGNGLSYQSTERECRSDEQFPTPRGMREQYGNGDRSCLVFDIHASEDCRAPALSVDVLDSSHAKIDRALTLTVRSLLSAGETAIIEAKSWQPNAAYFRVASGSCL